MPDETGMKRLGLDHLPPDEQLAAIKKMVEEVELKREWWRQGQVSEPEYQGTIDESVELYYPEVPGQHEQYDLFAPIVNPSPTNIHLLEDISYIIESLANGYGGEAKTELLGLIRKLNTNPKFDIQNKDEIIATLDSAYHRLIDDNRAGAARIITNLSREMWNKMREENDEKI
jgi:hypothetical protein